MTYKFKTAFVTKCIRYEICWFLQLIAYGKHGILYDCIMLTYRIEMIHSVDTVLALALHLHLQVDDAQVEVFLRGRLAGVNVFVRNGDNPLPLAGLQICWKFLKFLKIFIYIFIKFVENFKNFWKHYIQPLVAVMIDSQLRVNVGAFALIAFHLEIWGVNFTIVCLSFENYFVFHLKIILFFIWKLFCFSFENYFTLKFPAESLRVVPIKSSGSGPKLIVYSLIFKKCEQFCILFNI